MILVTTLFIFFCQLELFDLPGDIHCANISDMKYMYSITDVNCTSFSWAAKYTVTTADLCNLQDTLSTEKFPKDVNKLPTIQW